MSKEKFIEELNYIKNNLYSLYEELKKYLEIYEFSMKEYLSNFYNGKNPNVFNLEVDNLGINMFKEFLKENKNFNTAKTKYNSIRESEGYINYLSEIKDINYSFKINYLMFSIKYLLESLENFSSFHKLNSFMDNSMKNLNNLINSI